MYSVYKVPTTGLGVKRYSYSLALFHTLLYLIFLTSLGGKYSVCAVKYL